MFDDIYKDYSRAIGIFGVDSDVDIYTGKDGKVHLAKANTHEDLYVPSGVQIIDSNSINCYAYANIYLPASIELVKENAVYKDEDYPSHYLGFSTRVIFDYDIEDCEPSKEIVIEDHAFIDMLPDEDNVLQIPDRVTKFGYCMVGRDWRSNLPVIFIAGSDLVDFNLNQIAKFSRIMNFSRLTNKKALRSLKIDSSKWKNMHPILIIPDFLYSRLGMFQKPHFKKAFPTTRVTTEPMSKEDLLRLMQ